jgi:low affinity Fe/Cu permease
MERSFFRRLAHATAKHVGSSWAFFTALSVVLVWLITGPIFHYSDTWQLVINTATTIVTFLMVFLIQNTQNREALALQLKVDELICAVKAARNEMIELEEWSDEELENLHQQYKKIAEQRQSARRPPH